MTDLTLMTDVSFTYKKTRVNATVKRYYAFIPKLKLMSGCIQRAWVNDVELQHGVDLPADYSRAIWDEVKRQEPAENLLDVGENQV